MSVEDSVTELSDLAHHPPERITCSEIWDPIIEKSLKDGLAYIFISVVTQTQEASSSCVGFWM